MEFRKTLTSLVLALLLLTEVQAGVIPVFQPLIRETHAAVSTLETSSSVDLSIQKTGPATIQRGNVAVYDINVHNNGPDAATNVIVTDHILSGLTFDQGQSSGNCYQNGSDVLCDNFTVNANDNYAVHIAFNAPLIDNCSSVTIQNIASVASASLDSDLGNNQVTADPTVLNCPQQPQVITSDLAITKTGPTSIVRGTTAIYTVHVTNAGPDTATNVVVTDLLPAPGLTFNAGQSSLGCVLNGAQTAVLCNSFSLNSGDAHDVQIAFTVPTIQNCTTSSFQNIASVSSSSTDPDSSNNSFTALATTLTCPIPQLYITKDGPATVNAGGTITYNFTLRNTSSFTAPDVDVFDEFIDAGYNQIASPFTFVSATGLSCHFDAPSGKVECSAGDLTANQMISFTMTFQTPVNAPQLCNQLITNKGEAISNYNQATLDSDTAPTTLLCPTGQFTVSKLGPTNISPGELLNYLITITNTTQTSQNGVRLADVIPAGLTFVPNGSTAGCAEQGASVYCPVQTFTAGQAVSYTLRFQANQNIACNTPVLNTALVQQYGNQVAQSNQWSSDVQCTLPKLDITKSAPATVNAGGTITYSFVLHNTSQTQSASQVELYDFNIDALANPIPPSFNFLSVSLGSCDPLDAFDRIHCNLPDLAPNQTVNFTMTFGVPNSQSLCNKTVINQVDVWTQHDIDNADWDKAQTVVLCTMPSADLFVTKTGSASVVRGGIAYYQVTATNIGPDTATNVVITDPIPTGFTFNAVQSSAGCVLNGAQTSVLCNSFSLTAGSSHTVRIAFNVPTIAPCVQSAIQNTASVSSSSTDPVSSNNQSNAVITTLTCPNNSVTDLAITKIGPSSIVRGGVLTYNLAVSNAGPSFTPANIVVTDPIPQGQNLSFNQGASTLGCSQSGASIVCLGILGPNSSSNFLISFNVPMIGNCTDMNIQNTATVASQLTDSWLANNTSQTVTTSLLCPVTATSDVSILKTGPSSVVRGSTAVYTLTAANAGPAIATNVVIADHIPQGFTFSLAQSSSGCVLNGGQASVLCNNFNLNAGDSRSFQVAFTVPTIANCTESTIDNTASVSVSSVDLNPNNNQSLKTTTLVCPTVTIADLGVKLSGPAAADRGSNVVYTALVSNSGSSIAQAATVQIPLPNGLTFVSASGAACSVAGTTLTCALGSMTVGQNIAVVLTYNVPVLAPCPGPIMTQVNAFAASITSDSNNGNNTSQVNTVLNCTGTTAGGLTLYKTDNRMTANAGDTLHYTIILTNSANSSATNLTVTDAVPYGLTILTVSDGAVINGQNLTWNTITVNANSSRTLTVNAQVRSDVSNSTVLHNTANVSGQSSTDDTTITNTTTIYNPPYYPPYTPPYTPPYYPPYVPTTPPVFVAPPPPTFYPPVILPQTGTRDGNFYTGVHDESDTTKVTASDAATGDNFLAILVATLITIAATGSAAVGKLLTGL